MPISKRRRLLVWGIATAMLAIVATLAGILALSGVFSSATNPYAPDQVNEDPVGYTLKHVMIVHRHGLRAPSKISKWSDINYYPMGLGYLTAKGKIGAGLAGRVFRRFYQNYLTDSPREVWARSSTYARCFETEHILLGTMYPPQGIWNYGSPIQPIPIVMVPDGNDVFIESCKADLVPDFKYMYNETHKSLEKDGFDTVGDFFDWLTNVSGFPNDTSEFFEPVVDALFAQKYNDLPIPYWAEDKWLSMDWAMRRLSYDAWQEFVPYYGQYMGKQIAWRTTGAVNGSLTERLSIMSYHDTTLQALLKALKLKLVPLYPLFLAALHFQVYEKNYDGRYFVRIMYHQGFNVFGAYEKAIVLHPPDCDFPDCPLEKFAHIMNNIYNDTDRSACNPVMWNALL